VKEEVILNEDFYQKLRESLSENQIMIEEPLANHTTFQIGGPADFLVLPESISQVAFLVKLCNLEQMPFYILGKGSNLLVSDKGYRGIIIKIGQDFSKITIEDPEDMSPNGKCLVKAQAGIMLSKMANEIAEHSLEGFEFASGIPGTLGGAVTMNAGAYGGEMKDAIVSAVVADQSGNILELKKEELKLGYRRSIVQDKNYIVLEAVFAFSKGNNDEIRSKMNDLNARRKEKQPLEYPSAGSTFKRPEGYFAGKLIMDAGLSGFQIGGAQVSEKHCGFVINRGGASAADVRALISEVITIVNDKFGVMLEPEVKLLGEF
jgi:UDP-N-acetylmuramate dehydrogenase